MTYAEIVAGLEKWEYLGVRRYPNGDVVYGEPSHNTGWGWLHKVMAAIDSKLIIDFEKENPVTQNYKHIKALYQCNGVNLFSGGLVLYGLHLGGPLETAAYPFDIVALNIDLWPIAKAHDGLFVGGANFGYLSIHYLETQNGKLLAINSETEEVVHQWDTFEVFFKSEFDRLNRIFDKHGRPPSNYESRMYF